MSHGRIMATAKSKSCNRLMRTFHGAGAMEGPHKSVTTFALGRSHYSPVAHSELVPLRRSHRRSGDVNHHPRPREPPVYSLLILSHDVFADGVSIVCRRFRLDDSLHDGSDIPY